MTSAVASQGNTTRALLFDSEIGDAEDVVADPEASPSGLPANSQTTSIGLEQSENSGQQAISPQLLAYEQLAIHRLRMQELQDANLPIDGQLQRQFGELAIDEQRFHQTLGQIYGDNYDVAQAEQLRQRALNGDYSWLPRVEYVDAADLQGAMGAYSSDQSTIYIRSDLQGSTLAQQIFVEEAGHHLDTLINSTDSAGDEGELFRRLLNNESLTDAQLDSIQSEDDTGTLVLNGQQVSVEFWGGWEWFEDNVIEPTAEYVNDTVVAPVNEYVVQPVGEFVVEPIVDNVVAPALEASWPYIEPVVGPVIDNGVRAGNWVANTADAISGNGERRPLSDDEIAGLEPVFGEDGNAVSYDEITIQSGGVKQWLANNVDLRAHVIGNDIFLPEQHHGNPVFNADGTLTDEGVELLNHEFGHVWQFQNGGYGYIHDAIWAQSGPGQEGYDWRAAINNGVDFVDMNPEQQSEVARVIGEAIRADASGDLTIEALSNEFGSELTDAQFQIFTDAHTTLQTGLEN